MTGSSSPRNRSNGVRGGHESLVGIGLTFTRDKSTGNYVVKRVVDGGSAWKSCQIKQGDTFDEVDGLRVSSLVPEDLCRYDFFFILRLFIKTSRILTIPSQAYSGQSREFNRSGFGARWK